MASTIYKLINKVKKLGKLHCTFGEFTETFTVDDNTKYFIIQRSYCLDQIKNKSLVKTIKETFQNQELWDENFFIDSFDIWIRIHLKGVNKNKCDIVLSCTIENTDENSTFNPTYYLYNDFTFFTSIDKIKNLNLLFKKILTTRYTGKLISEFEVEFDNKSYSVTNQIPYDIIDAFKEGNSILCEFYLTPYYEVVITNYQILK